MARTHAQDAPHPHFRDLTRTECEALLSRNNVGRMAFSFHDRVDIEPLHYVYADGWLYGRTGTGTKIATVQHHPWVAFEVDEHEGLFDWRSVVVKGAFYPIEADGGPIREDPTMTRGIALLRSLLPETLMANDPVPFRRSIFRVHLDEVTGRESRST
jgi:nitroimidazol reductase NimA-like FMN-containing flavoprotein (pyridoxamine 5'-phosphate oxidase superfamily)